jgi:hypothetical protein
MPLLRPEQRQHILRHLTLLFNIIIIAVASIVHSTFEPSPCRDPEPYHTSALSGEGWLLELLTGHPERIRNELGMYAETFSYLVSHLRDYGHVDSRFVSLEEQLAIFLYTSVTGLTITHVAERFQRSNDTISR